MPRVREHKFEAYADNTWARFLHDEPDQLAVDTETTGLTWQDTPFGISVSWHGHERIESGWLELENEVGHSRASDILIWHRQRGKQFIFYNAKFDLRMLLNYGLLEDTRIDYIDVMPAVALLDPIGEHSLKANARKYLGAETYQDAQVKRARKELKLTRDDGYWPLPREVVVPYAMKDTEYTLRLYDKLMPMIQERGLQVAFDKEMRLIDVLMRMERKGLKTVPEEARAAIRECDARISAARGQIEELVGRKVGKAKRKVKVPNGVSEKTGRELFKTVEVPEDFNPASPAQLLTVFKERGVTLKSTESKILEQVDDPLVGPLLTLRSEEKLRGTYLVPLLKEADENGILHPNFNPYGTVTGRFSSGGATQT